MVLSTHTLKLKFYVICRIIFIFQYKTLATTESKKTDTNAQKSILTERNN